MHVLVFTDLDGTLLDHGYYAYKAALPGLELIRHRKIPLIFTSSKTRLEIETLQAGTGIRDPFIAENGAAVFFPARYRNFDIHGGVPRFPYTVIQLGVAYREIRDFFDSVKGRFDLKGFGDWPIEQIASLTGLSTGQASMAKQREFTEPFLMGDESKIDELAAAAAASGLTITPGSRFYHLMGNRQDKGRAVRLCTEVFAGNLNGEVVTIGLGDSANDIPMLENVDIPILIPHPDGSFEKIDRFNPIKADRPGSAGWNDATLKALDSLEERRTTT
jgi:mannosyl-3-phosphoglycerate phosphatase